VEHPILGDRFAADAVARIDYDFKQLKLPNGGEITLPLRAWHFDQWTRGFLAANPESTVLHLGCGLDTRVYRIDPRCARRRSGSIDDMAVSHQFRVTSDLISRYNSPDTST